MPEIRRFLSRLIAFFRAGKAESELTREVNAHLQLLADGFVAKGMRPEEARYAAKRAFGGVEQAKERQRDTRSFRWLAGWSMDLKLGARMLVKTPGLTIIGVIALAVGIAAGAAYFEFVTDLLRPTLSFPGADRLVGLLNWDLAKGDVEDRSLYELAAWKTQLTTVEELGAARQIEESLITEHGRGEAARGWEISASAFRVVPIPPLYGRPLLDDDEKPAAADVVVIGEDLWKARFNSDPTVIGRTVRLGETIRTVVGVMPRAFGFPLSSTLWTPLRLDAATIKRGEGPPIRIFGRLAPGADLNQARAELETIAGRMPGRMDAGHANPAAGMRASIHPYVESFWTDFSRSAMNTLFLIVYSSNILLIGLLGICAANVATLVFARTATRESEITIRTALGAGRGRIVAQLVAEALVLASVAAIAGLAGATFALRKVREMWDATGSPLPFWLNEQLSIDTIAYSVLLVMIAALLVGGVPALKATGPQMNARLKEAGAGGATMRLGKLWTGVIVTQVAVTVLFLLVIVSSGWIAYLQVWQPAEVAFSRNEYLFGLIALEEGATAERQMAVRSELQRRLNADPDVINSTFATGLPGDVDVDELWLELPSTSGERGEAIAVHEAEAIGSNYFETFQQPLVAGRLFTASEIEESRNVVIVDETFVRLVLGGKNAIGQLVRQSRTEGSDKPGPWQEIVGVVKDITLAPNKTTADAMLYRPSPPDDNGWRIVVHSRSNQAAVRLRAAATATDPQIRLFSVMTFDQEIETDARTVSVFMTAIGIIAAVLLMLAAAGIHSLISFTLASRTREIGIRTALGAAPLRIVTGILSPAFMKVGMGLALGGIPGIALVSAWLDWGISFQMTVVAAACVALFVIAVVMISCIWPIRRALKIQPTEALRTT
jgi:putative ABC transport system permease protein